MVGLERVAFKSREVDDYVSWQTWRRSAVFEHNCHNGPTSSIHESVLDSSDVPELVGRQHDPRSDCQVYPRAKLPELVWRELHCTRIVVLCVLTHDWCCSAPGDSVSDKKLTQGQTAKREGSVHGSKRAGSIFVRPSIQCEQCGPLRLSASGGAM
jgi:hypothetical protein